jgi:putative inorganic carbon (HCO3(-)) transporter
MLAQEPIRAYLPVIVLGSLTIFAPLIAGGTTHLPVLIIRLILLTALTAWVLLSMKSGALTVYRTRLVPVIAVFVAWAALWTVLSPYMAVSLQWLVSLLSYAAMLFLVLHLVESSEQVRWLVAVILGMGLFEAVVGVSQFLAGPERPTGTFFNPNFFAAYEAAVFALAFGLLCFGSRIGPSPSRWGRPLLWVTTVIVGLAFVLAQSRGALLAITAAVGFVGWYRFGRKFLAIFLVVLLAGATIPNPLQQRIVTAGQDPYAFTRLEIWKNSLQRISDHPWGMGLGVYKYASFQYRFPIEDAIARYAKRAESAHNEYLQMAVELGLVGLALFLTGIGLLGREIHETLRGPLESWERGVVIGLTGGLLGLLAHGAVDSVFHEPALVLLLLLFAGLVLAVRRLKISGSVPAWVAPFPYHPARAALVVVLSALLALVSIRPAAAWYAYEAGEREMSIGQAGRALERFRWATRIDPGTSAYHDAVAFAELSLYRQSGDLGWVRLAMSDLRVGLEVNPLDGRLAHRLGNLALTLADRVPEGAAKDAALEQAAAYWTQAVRLDPYAPFNYHELGKLRSAQGRAEEAQAWFERATSVEPNFLPARVSLADLALQRGRPAIAAAEYAEIVRIKERYRGRTLNPVERQFLEVESEHLKKALVASGAP